MKCHLFSFRFCGDLTGLFRFSFYIGRKKTDFNFFRELFFLIFMITKKNYLGGDGDGDYYYSLENRNSQLIQAHLWPQRIDEQDKVLKIKQHSRERKGKAQAKVRGQDECSFHVKANHSDLFQKKIKVNAIGSFSLAVQPILKICWNVLFTDLKICKYIYSRQYSAIAVAEMIRSEPVQKIILQTPEKCSKASSWPSSETSFKI